MATILCNRCREDSEPVSWPSVVGSTLFVGYWTCWCVLFLWLWFIVSTLIVHSYLWVVLPQCHVSLLVCYVRFIWYWRFYHRNDIAGFQNRLGTRSAWWVCFYFTLFLPVFAGIFFFTLALFGFSCLSSLASGLFANERILFMKERCVPGSTFLLSTLWSLYRSNGYYSSLTYFSSKVLRLSNLLWLSFFLQYTGFRFFLIYYSCVSYLRSCLVGSSMVWSD